MKVNFLGLGRVFEHYYRILEGSGIKINLSYDIDLEKRELAKGLCPVADTYEDFMKEHCDLVCVLTPSGTHYDIVKNLLESKKNVLVEKPMALHPEECKELKKKAEENGVKLYADFKIDSTKRSLVKHLRITK